MIQKMVDSAESLRQLAEMFQFGKLPKSGAFPQDKNKIEKRAGDGLEFSFDASYMIQSDENIGKITVCSTPEKDRIQHIQLFTISAAGVQQPSLSGMIYFF